ncbi:MAG: D-sedoheptulose 7-phosphate isomerase [Myxococcota bacterium]
MSDVSARPPLDPARELRGQFEESVRVKRAFAAEGTGAMAKAAELVIEAFRAGRKALLFGNGGSAADAQHIADEWTGRFRRERPALPAIALCANTSDLTAIGNDYGFDQVFARLVAAHGQPGDIALALSTSGNSPNVLVAVEEARRRRLHTIGLTGKGGGRLAGEVDVALVVPSDATARIQECHMTFLHALCELVDEALFPESPGA